MGHIAVLLSESDNCVSPVGLPFLSIVTIPGIGSSANPLATLGFTAMGSIFVY
jgi:hypothetical protein